MKNIDLGIIIQARTGSTRLPLKIIKPFFNEKGILEVLIERLLSEKLNIPIIVATTDSVLDDVIQDVCRNHDVQYYRGSELNVLNRYICAAREFGINKIIRICSDNPFIDMESLRFLIYRFKNNDFDYGSFCLSDNTPIIKTHYGFWIECVKLSALEVVANKTKDVLFLEHVTNYIYTFPDQFKIDLIQIDKEIESNSFIRLTVDTIVDFDIAKSIYGFLKNKNISFTPSNIISEINNNERWAKEMEEQIKKNKK